MAVLTDGAALIGRSNSASKISGAITVGSNENRILLVWVDRRGTTAVSSVKAGGVTMEQLLSKSKETIGTADLWALVAPATGSLEIAVEFAGTAIDPLVFATSLKGASQTGGTGTYRTTGSVAESATNPKVALTTVAGDLLVSNLLFLYGGGGAIGSVSSEEVLDAQEHTADFETLGAISHKPATGSSTTTEWTLTEQHSVVLLAVAVVAAASTPHNLTLLGVGA